MLERRKILYKSHRDGVNTSLNKGYCVSHSIMMRHVFIFNINQYPILIITDSFYIIGSILNLKF